LLTNINFTTAVERFLQLEFFCLVTTYAFSAASDRRHVDHCVKQLIMYGDTVEE